MEPTSATSSSFPSAAANCWPPLPTSTRRTSKTKQRNWQANGCLYTYPSDSCLPRRPPARTALRALPSCDDVLLERCRPERHTSKSTEINILCREEVSQSQKQNLSLSLFIFYPLPSPAPFFPSIPYCVAHLHGKLNKVRCSSGTGDSTCPRVWVHLRHQASLPHRG